MSNVEKKKRLNNPGCMKFLSQVQTLFLIAQKTICNRLPVLLRAFCN